MISIRLSFTAIPLVLLAIYSPVAAQLVTLTMDDLPTQQLNGLVHPAGVSFEFTEAGLGSANATYNASGPGELAYVQDPSIEGVDCGVVTMTFQRPTEILGFGLSLTSTRTGSVSLFDADGLELSRTIIEAEPSSIDPDFFELRFEYQGHRIRRGAIGFLCDGLVPGRFALDNLTFLVPEPNADIPFVLTILLVTLRSRQSRIAQWMAWGQKDQPNYNRFP